MNAKSGIDPEAKKDKDQEEPKAVEMIETKTANDDNKQENQSLVEMYETSDGKRDEDVKT